MVWKILSVALLIAIILICIKLSANGSEIHLLKSRIATAESDKYALQNQITRLESEKNSSQNDLESKMAELKMAIDEIGARYPISLNEITFNNVDKDFNKITTNSHEFNKNYLQCLQPVITFNSNLRTGGEYNVYYKIINPNGIMESAATSPAGYTWFKTVNIYGNFIKNSTEELGWFSLSWSNNTGRYKVEIWCNNFLAGESYFTVND